MDHMLDCIGLAVGYFVVVVVQVLGPLSDDVLAYMDQWDGTTKISVTLPSLYVILSPPTVRLVLNTVQSLTVSHVSIYMQWASVSIYIHMHTFNARSILLLAMYSMHNIMPSKFYTCTTILLST